MTNVETLDAAAEAERAAAWKAWRVAVEAWLVAYEAAREEQHAAERAA